MKEFEVLNSCELLEFLFNNLEYKKKDIKSFLTHGNIRVNDKVITKYNYNLKKGNVVKLVLSKSDDLDILYEDKDIVVVNKPSGLLTIATNKNNNTLYSMMSCYVKKTNPKNKIFVIHRLDQDTSGIVMFSKSEKIKNLYQDNWDSLVVKRGYIAIVDGITKDSDTLQDFLTENDNFMTYVTNHRNGKLAITNYKKIKFKNDKTWLDIDIETGRKNQIRVQLSNIGNPIVGDRKYGGSNYKRLCLHANKLIIMNPITKKEMAFNSLLPRNMEKLKNILR